MPNSSDNSSPKMARIRDFFTYRSSLSRIGFALAFAFTLLGFVAYLKGIQILMFVPALAAALFVRSWWEIRTRANRSVIGWSAGAFLALVALGFAGRRGLRRVRESGEDRLSRYLSDSAGNAFPLAAARTTHASLVAETERALYGKPADTDRSAKELLQSWRRVRREN